MIVKVDTEVIPVWFIEHWAKEEAVEGSPLRFFIDEMLKAWKMEEKRQARSALGTGREIRCPLAGGAVPYFGKGESNDGQG